MGINKCLLADGHDDHAKMNAFRYAALHICKMSKLQLHFNCYNF